MKNALMLLHDRIMLRKRDLIESVNDELKNLCQIEHTRHRCFDNFIINVLSALAAFSFFDKKPSINTTDDLVEKDKLVVA
jgi:DNA-binding TFAR19-related protein (PDSD5 family)